MIQKKPLFTIILILLMSQSIIAQENIEMDKLRTVTTNAPTTAGLGRYGEYPVNHVYGLPNIGIPLLEYGSGSIKQKINLSYHAGGIKVKDKAGWVGLGWSLNAGGVITKSINGADDLRGYFKNAKSILSYEGTTNRLLGSTHLLPTDSIIKGLKMADDLVEKDAFYERHDFEPDFYNINAPGISGTFVFDEDWKPILTNKALPIKVVDFSRDVVTSNYYQPDFTSREYIYGFQVTDENGFVYTFGDINDATDCKCKESTNSWPNYSEYLKTGSTFAYYLTKIESPDGIDTVDFTYERDVTITDTHTSASITRSPGGNGYPCIDDDRNWKSALHIETHTVKLRKISFNNGKIEFFRSAGLSGEDSKLNSIIQYQKNGGLTNSSYTAIKTINFNYAYFINKDNTKQLKLSGIAVKGKDNSVVQPYSFDYNPLKLPGKYSTDLDHWGYYNGAGNPGTSEFGAMEYDKLGLIPSVIINGVSQGGIGNRDSNENFTQAGILNKIDYPTGGSSKFKYENHKVGTTVVGGLRIKQIVSYKDSNSLQVSTIKEYEYFDGYYLGVQPYLAGGYASYVKTYLKDCVECIKHYLPPYCEFSETAQYQLRNNAYSFTSNGRGIYQGTATTAYKKVIEKRVDENGNSSGYTVYKYLFSPDTAGRGPFQNFGFRREKNTFIGQYNKNNNPIKEVEYEYTDNYHKTIAYGVTASRNNITVRLEDVILGCCSQRYVDFTFDYFIETYGVSQYRNMLSKTIEKTYNTSGSDYVSNTTEYSYRNSGHPFPVRIKQTNSKGETLFTDKKYSMDFYASSLSSPLYNQLHQLQEKHILTPVIRQIELKNYKVTNAVITEYFGIHPRTVYGFDAENLVTIPPSTESDTPSTLFPYQLQNYMKPRLHLNYAGVDKLVSQKMEDGSSTSYIWGYNKEYPIVKVEDATTSEIRFLNYEWNGDGVIQSHVINTDAHTGKSSARLFSGYQTGQLDLYNASHNSYVYSAWVKSAGGGYLEVQNRYDLTNKGTKTVTQYFWKVGIC